MMRVQAPRERQAPSHNQTEHRKRRDLQLGLGRLEVLAALRRVTVVVDDAAHVVPGERRDLVIIGHVGGGESVSVGDAVAHEYVNVPHALELDGDAVLAPSRDGRAIACEEATRDIGIPSSSNFCAIVLASPFAVVSWTDTMRHDLRGRRFRKKQTKALCF